MSFSASRCIRVGAARSSPPTSSELVATVICSHDKQESTHSLGRGRSRIGAELTCSQVYESHYVCKYKW